VKGPDGWRPVVNGGAWLVVEEQRVDLCYRDMAEVLAEVEEAEAGRFRIEALATFVTGIPSYVPVGEAARHRVLRRPLARRQPPPPRDRRL
jgi:hypothetical protein